MRLAVIASVLSPLLLAATASTALAGPPSRTPPIDDATPPAPEVKSESTATILALGTTLGGFALMGAGADRGNDHVMVAGMAMVLIGPSAGHFYAGETSHAVKMSLLRTGGALVLGMGLVASLTTEDVSAGAPCPTDSVSCTTTTHGHGDRRTPERMMWLGGGVLVAATLYDLWDAHNAARRTNEKAQRAWTIAPMIAPGAGGFSVAGAF